MKVIRGCKYVKIIPIKFKSVVDGYSFKTESKRLSPEERFDLIIRLIRANAEISKNSRNLQIRFGANMILDSLSLGIVKVTKRSGTEWRVKTTAGEVNVSYDLVDDCPKQYLIEKHEF